MATKEKKVLLFIVEGISDKVSLQAILESYFDSKKVQISVFETDITQKSFPSTIKAELNLNIQIFCSVEKLKIKDIQKIIHIVDTDGTFAPENSVIQDINRKTISYTETEIITKDKDSIIKRNKNKASILSTLCKMRNLTVSAGRSNFSIPYSVFYFSRNLEHVLHNRIESLTKDDKKELSNQFDEDYNGDAGKFKAFISEPTFAVSGDYLATWEFIKKDNNSLKRYTNLHLLFKE